jgi:hypothetical protein
VLESTLVSARAFFKAFFKAFFWWLGTRAGLFCFLLSSTSRRV